MFFSSSLIGDSAFDAAPNATTQTKTPLLICLAALETCVWPPGFLRRSFRALWLSLAAFNYFTVSLSSHTHFDTVLCVSLNRSTIPLYHRLVTVFDVMLLQVGKKESIFTHAQLLCYISLWGRAWNTVVQSPINLVLICPSIEFREAHPPSLPYYQTVYLREN